MVDWLLKFHCCRGVDAWGCNRVSVTISEYKVKRSLHSGTENWVLETGDAAKRAKDNEHSARPHFLLPRASLQAPHQAQRIIAVAPKALFKAALLVINASERSTRL
jgi:hypothetical protein